MSRSNTKLSSEKRKGRKGKEEERRRNGSKARGEERRKQGKGIKEERKRKEQPSKNLENLKFQLLTDVFMS